MQPERAVLWSAGLLIELCVICLVVLEKLFVLVAHFLREEVLVLVCGSCALVLDLLSTYCTIGI